jgi:ring-1,2-phenylacetyl-CoA epoxidase subunit PaaD
MDMIEVNIRSILQENGIDNIHIETNLSPAWTTDWITEDGRKSLVEAGITPPQGSADKRAIAGDFDDIPCPTCNSMDTEMISQFGTTACKALFKCNTCLEPFHYFKCH